MNPIRLQKIATMHRLKAQIKNKTATGGQTLKKMSMIKAYSLRLQLTPTSITSPSKTNLTNYSKNTLVTKL